MFDLPQVLVVIVAALFAVQLLRDFLPEATDDMVLGLFAFIPDRFYLQGGESVYPGGLGALAWSFVTYAGLHGSWMHLIFNAVMLAAVGRVVVMRFGTVRFLALVVVTAAAGAAAHLIVDRGSEAPMIGASGVVFGVMGAALRFVFVPGWGRLPSAFGALALPKVRGFIFALVAMNVLLVLFGTAPFGGGGGDEGGVAWGAHLGGFLAGFFGFRVFDPARGRE